MDWLQIKHALEEKNHTIWENDTHIEYESTQGLCIRCLTPMKKLDTGIGQCPKCGHSRDINTKSFHSYIVSKDEIRNHLRSMLGKKVLDLNDLMTIRYMIHKMIELEKNGNEFTELSMGVITRK